MTTTISNGRYILAEKLGDGGMGTVYKGMDTHTDQPVAIKQLKPQVAEPDNIARFLREAQVLRDLNHPNIVTIMDSIDDGSDHYIVMEFVSGGDLSKLIKQGRIPAQEIVNLSIDLVDALTRAHRLDIIHRDIKPENVLIAEDKTLRLTDFGVARVRHTDENATDADVLVGTLGYMPPEAFNNGTIDARSDIWAFGVLLYEMLIGQNPFHADTVIGTIQAISTEPIPDIEALVPDAPPALIDLIYRMLERDPRHRIPSVRIVGAELEALLEGRDTAIINTRKTLETPSIQTTTIKKHNLPAQPTPFVGREAELEELASLLADAKIRMVTVLAPGGMGKTRLALEAAEKNLNHFADGVYFVELAPLSDADNIITEIASALNIQMQGDPKQQVLNYLQDKTMLLVLDNWEHLQEGSALVSDILKAAPDVKILNTSRVRLGQMGETLFHLSGMDFPQWETPEDAKNYAAIKLFMNSAVRAQPNFELTIDNLDYVARICRLVQGMPLGIVLAAAWLSLLSPEEIAEELQQGMDILADELGELPERQQSIRLVMDYAWQSMSEAEQTVFMKLALFRGGFTREAAQAVTGANLRVLMSLVNKSLIRRDNATGRYEIHELLRQFGEEQLAQSAEHDETQDAYINYFTKFLGERLAPIKGSKKQFEIVTEIKREIDNIQRASLWASQQKQTDALRIMIPTLHHYFYDFYNYFEGVTFYEKVHQILSNHDGIKDELIFHIVQAHYAECLTGSGRIEEALPLSDASLEFAQQHKDDLYLQFFAHRTRGRLYSAFGDVETSDTWLHERMRPIARAIDDKWYTLDTMLGMSFLYSLKGVAYQDKMMKTLKDGIALADEIDNLILYGLFTNNLQAVTMATGNWEEAEKLIRSSLERGYRLNQTNAIMNSLTKLARLHVIYGNFEEARRAAQEALELALVKPDYLQCTSAHMVFATLAEHKADYKTAELHTRKTLEYAEKTELWAYVHGAKIRLQMIDFYSDPTAEKITALVPTIDPMLKNYQLLIRLSTVILVAKFAEFNGTYERATELLASVMIYPKTHPSYQTDYKPIAILRDNLKAELDNDEFEKAWQRGTERGFEETVKMLKLEYAPEKIDV